MLQAISFAKLKTIRLGFAVAIQGFRWLKSKTNFNWKKETSSISILLSSLQKKMQNEIECDLEVLSLMFETKSK